MARSFEPAVPDGLRWDGTVKFTGREEVFPVQGGMDMVAGESDGGSLDFGPGERRMAGSGGPMGEVDLSDMLWIVQQSSAVWMWQWWSDVVLGAME